MPIGEDALADYSLQHRDRRRRRSPSSRRSRASRPRSRRSSTGRTSRRALPVIKKLPGAQKCGDITLKRGKTDNKALWDWIKQVQDGNIDGARKNGSIVLYDYEHGESRRFNFINALAVEGQSIGTLQAGGNEVLIEECTIVHEGLAPA